MYTICVHVAKSLIHSGRQQRTQLTESSRTGLNMNDVSMYLFPRAVITVRVKSHRLRFELLEDLLTLIQQTHSHLVGATTICPPAVPAGRVPSYLAALRRTTHMRVKSYQSSTVTTG